MQCEMMRRDGRTGKNVHCLNEATHEWGEGEERIVLCDVHSASVREVTKFLRKIVDTKKK